MINEIENLIFKLNPSEDHLLISLLNTKIEQIKNGESPLAGYKVEYTSRERKKAKVGIKRTMKIFIKQNYPKICETDSELISEKIASKEEFKELIETKLLLTKLKHKLSLCYR